MKLSFFGWLLLKSHSIHVRIASNCWSAYYSLLLRIHPSVTLLGPITVTGRMIWKIDPRGRIVIGRNVRIHSGPLVNAVGGHRKSIICVLPGGMLTIGDHSGISSSTIVCQQRMEIGERVMIGGGCDLFDTDFHPLDLAARQRHDPTQVRSVPVVIERGAWIGGNATVGKGVRIGSEAVIGAGAVVTKSVPAREIWVGNPARIARSLATVADETIPREP